MTLAISRSDATRMLEASRKFNVEISRMQEEELAEIEADDKDGAEEEGERDGAAAEEVNKKGKPKSKGKGKGKGKSKGKGGGAGSKKKKGKSKKGKKGGKNESDKHGDASIEDAGDGESTRAASSAEKERADEGADEDEKRSPSPSVVGKDDDERSSPEKKGGPKPPKRTSTNALRREGAARNREQRRGRGPKKEKKKKKPTPLRRLLVPAAERCGDGLISSYLRRMRSDGRPEREIEACLLLFLDVDKSAKLAASFEIMGAGGGGRRKKRRRNEKASAAAGGNGDGSGDGGSPAAAVALLAEGSGSPVDMDSIEIKATPLNLEDAMDMDLDDMNDMGFTDLGAATPSTKGMDAGLSEMCLSSPPSPKDVLPSVSASVDESDDPGLQCANTPKAGGNSDGDDGDDDEEEASAPPPVTNADVRSLFRCFLTSISTCIHHDEENGGGGGGGGGGNGSGTDKSAPSAEDPDESNDGSSSRKSARKSDDARSPRSVAASAASSGSSRKGDWVLSDRTKREIEGIAEFAAQCLAEFVWKRNAGEKKGEDDDGATVESKGTNEAAAASSSTSEKGSGNENLKGEEGEGRSVEVTFEVFGDWYNSGGFSLVPWLELLDLAKWDFASRAAAAAAAAAASSEKFHKRSIAARNGGGLSGMGGSFDDGMPPMGSIAEEKGGPAGCGVDDMDGMGGVDDTMGLGPLPDLPSLPRSLKRLAGDEPDPNYRRAGGTARNLFSPPSDPAPQHHRGGAGEFGPAAAADRKSRTVVSFDFTGAMPPGSNGAHRPFHICITEENLRMLKGLVNRTGLSENNPDKVAEVLLRQASSRGKGGGDIGGGGEGAMMLHRDDFGRCVREIVPPHQSQAFDRAELENYSNYLTNFFTCFNCTRCSAATGGSADDDDDLGYDYADAKELAVGFSFLCAGNKSSKLATAFELLDDGNSGHLTRRKLAQYLRSYLTMLVGISLLSESTAHTAETRRTLRGFCAAATHERRNSAGGGGGNNGAGAQQRMRNRYPETADMFTAVENGARWTQQQFLRTYEDKLKARGGSNGVGDKITFEDFAEWYTEGGYTVAPWLELLDLTKFLSLINDAGGDGGGSDRSVDDRYSDTPHHGHQSSSKAYGRNNLSTPRMNTPPNAHKPPSAGGAASQQPSAEILFTFPLANRQSLVVLREDATYVRSVVQQLGLLAMTPEGAWDTLYAFVRKRPVPASALAGDDPAVRAPRGTSAGKGMDVDEPTFVRAMQVLLPGMNASHPPPPSSGVGSGEVTSTPTETLQNFFQSFDLDQIGLVAANELMGGLALLCGGKKSAKLAFAFGLFDGRDDSGENGASDKNKKGGKKGKGKKGGKKAKKGSKTSKDNAASSSSSSSALQRQSQAPHSLDGTELFLFLRSLLIVLFSCCRQSLHLSADDVSRYIYDTAHTVAEDVMQYRRSRHRRGIGNGSGNSPGRVDFDEFGEWYNEGGFETAPWLELLDLNKWVLLEDLAPPDAAHPPQQGTNGESGAGAPGPSSKKTAAAVLPSPSPRGKRKSPSKTMKGSGSSDDMLAGCPPPPPDDAIDPHTDPFVFGDDMDMGMGGMGGIDEMDFHILGKENQGSGPNSLPATPSRPGALTPARLMDGLATPAGMDMALASPSPRRNPLPPLQPQPHQQQHQRQPPPQLPSPTKAEAPAPKLARAPGPGPGPAPAPAPVTKPMPPPPKIQPEYKLRALPLPPQRRQPSPPAPAPAPVPPAPKVQPEYKTASASGSRSGALPPPAHSQHASQPPPPQPGAHPHPHPPPTHPQHPPQPSTSLKFHLLTSEEHGGYVISISQTKIRHLRRLVIDSGLYKVDVTDACRRIVDRAVVKKGQQQNEQGPKGTNSNGGEESPSSSQSKKLVLTKDRFDSAMRRVVALAKSRMTTETQRSLSDLLNTIYRAFDASSSSSKGCGAGGAGGGTGEVDALELASGFTILCGGRKSDKLEHAFDLLLDGGNGVAGSINTKGSGKDQAPPPVDGEYDRGTMARYLRSFLTILLSVATCKGLEGGSNSSGKSSPPSVEDPVVTMKGGRRCDDITDAILLGSDWAAAQVFDALASNGGNSNKPPAERTVGFDDFADWYTKGGYTSIPWLELLDLKKWVLTAPPPPPPPTHQPPPPQQGQGRQPTVPPPQAPR